MVCFIVTHNISKIHFGLRFSKTLKLQKISNFFAQKCKYVDLSEPLEFTQEPKWISNILMNSLPSYAGKPDLYLNCILPV